MSRGRTNKQANTNRVNPREQKDRLLRELKTCLKVGNQKQALFVIGALLMHDDTRRTASRALRKLLMAGPEPVFRGCAEMLNLGDAALCEAICAEVLVYTQRDKSFLNLLGVATEAQGRSAEAVKIYTEVVRKDPNWSEARSNLAQAKLSLGRVLEAIEDLNVALRINPVDTGALLNRSTALVRENMLDDAFADLEQLLSIDPCSVDGLLNKGLLLSENGKLDEVEKVVERLFTVAPRNAGAHRLAIEVSRRKLDFDRAIELGETAAQLFPNDINVLLELATVDLAKGELHSAFERVKEVLRLNKPEMDEQPLLLGASILHRHGNETDEYKFLSAALEKMPSSPAANHRMGIFSRQKRDWKAALTYFSRAGKETPFSTGFELEALYYLQRHKEFLQRHEELLDQGIGTVVSGAVATHAEIELGTAIKNPFCPSPMDFIYSSMLEACDRFLPDALIKIEETSDFRSQLLLNNGQQTLSTLFHDDPLLRLQMEAAIKSAVARYCDAFSSTDSHYLKVLRTEPLFINAWAITMQTQGFLRPHIHENGWLSGTIYLKVPPKGNGSEGDIAFSTGGIDYPTRSGAHREKTVAVQEGQINVFPASLFHRTVPFESAKTSRVCIAFDVCPQRFNGWNYSTSN